jgi:TolB-like protein/Flp pilus assembly protein TadD
MKREMMQGEPPTQASAPAGAVFLSYASQDAGAAKRICDALRAAGIEVWFDQSELRGGDAWDRKIRQEIRDCALFVPVISAHSDARREGYFRREWRLAVERAGDMSERVAFLVPVVVDDTSDSRADVPDRFREVQWTRLPKGDTSAAFVERVRRLLSPEPSTTTPAPTSAQSGVAAIVRAPMQTSWSPKRGLLVTGGLVVLGATAYFAVEKPWISKPAVSSARVAASAAAAAFTPPPHSIAVLPFVNMSGDAGQAYFSDGLTEELLNSLSRINELQVAARTSSFSFQGEHPDIATVAHKLNVAAVLEGSVRRSAHTLRITVQLVNGSTGYHLWSQTYDRDLGDVLALQTEIATAVAGALKATLLGDVAAKIEMGGSRNPAAFDAYLRASQAYWSAGNSEEEQASIAAYGEAIRLDPNYALAYASRSLALGDFARHFASGTAVYDNLAKAQADASKAIALTPDLAEGHLALGAVLEESSFDFAGAGMEFERAVTLAPGNARALTHYGLYASLMGRSEAGLAAARRAIVLDPLNSSKRVWLCHQLFLARRYTEAIAPCQDAIALDSREYDAPGLLGFANYELGNFQGARTSCERRADTENAQICLAVTYNKLGQHTDADSMVLKLRASRGDAVAYHLGRIYAQWGNAAEALESLNTAMREHSPWIEWLKTDPLLDPLRTEPRFQAIEKALKFPD